MALYALLGAQMVGGQSLSYDSFTNPELTETYHCSDVRPSPLHGSGVLRPSHLPA